MVPVCILRRQQCSALICICLLLTADLFTLSKTLQDMAPYVPLLMPELQNALVDPLPEVRATAAHALGSLLRGMGEQHFQGLMPWLLTTLKSEVHRPGSWRFLMQVC